MECTNIQPVHPNENQRKKKRDTSAPISGKKKAQKKRLKHPRKKRKIVAPHRAAPAKNEAHLTTIPLTV